MKKVLGNYINQPNLDFPLDCETLNNMQNNSILIEMLGSIAGDKIILTGCEETTSGTRNSGYVFLRTISYPEGEILYLEEGNRTTSVTVMNDAVAVNANGYNYSNAYTQRYLANGVGKENYSWSDFTNLTTTAALSTALQELKDKLEAVTGEPLGIVKMWAGQSIPDNYALCDGQELSITLYSDLFANLGSVFNNAADANGIKQTTTTGYFRLPDLRGRFVVGYHNADSEYQTKGNVGGEKKHILTEAEMPKHSHDVDDFYFAENSNAVESATYKKTMKDYNNNNGAGDRDWDNDTYLYYTHPSAEVGGGTSHENRPPYYVLAYIMRIK